MATDKLILSIHDSYHSAFSQPVVYISLFASLVFLLTLFFTTKYYGIVKTTRQQCYIMTVPVSSTMTLASAYFLYGFFTQNGTWQDKIQYVLYERWWTVALTVLFTTYLVTDLVLGAIFYPDKMDILTAWIHHILYSIALIWVIKMKYTQLFIFACIMEAPSFMLALGSLNKDWRSDRIFAALFISTRLVFHGWLEWYFALYHPNKEVWKIMVTALPVHLFWFYKFILQQIRLAKLKVKAA
ncbi:hypothetical protein BZG36_05745 [Bifiguratus adelaidae]|uniref:TLC domain-containing protein n=1 Tax=Bifiguratus adelaidae TaxID=1938954 RepID=A0A261XUB3_9FUNG|nr:hypothetical protein BZG36_05745 [Bifiguratus adelaidae]